MGAVKGKIYHSQVGIQFPAGPELIPRRVLKMCRRTKEKGEEQFKVPNEGEYLIYWRGVFQNREAILHIAR